MEEQVVDLTSDPVTNVKSAVVTAALVNKIGNRFPWPVAVGFGLATLYYVRKAYQSN